MTAPAFALVMAFAVGISFLFERFRVLAPFMFGGMAAGGFTHATGWLPGAPPTFIVDASMFLIGIFAGSRVAGISLESLRKMFVPALVSFLATMAVTAIGASLAIVFAVQGPQKRSSPLRPVASRR